MNDNTFENLKVWQEAIELAVQVYELFRKCRDFEFRGQIQAAAVSVSNNIAEGYERSSTAEFIRLWIWHAALAVRSDRKCMSPRAWTWSLRRQLNP